MLPPMAALAKLPLIAVASTMSQELPMAGVTPLNCTLSVPPSVTDVGDFTGE